MSSVYNILSAKPHNAHYLKRYCKFIKEQNPMFGRTTVYDLELKTFTSVPKEEYKLLKNIRYFNPNSKYVKENVK